MKLLKQGILIAIEGIDGSGKSTLAHNLYNKLSQEHIPAILTREPGATPLGKQLRSLLHKRPFDICPKAEYLLFAADRAQHIQQVIVPALKEHNIVISDRMGDSSVVYQGYTRGLGIEMIKKINSWAMNNIHPNLTFYVQLSVNQAVERIKQRNEALTSFEKEGTEFLQSLVDGFNDLYKDRSDVIILDGTQSPEQLTEQAYSSLISWIEKHER